MARKGFTVSLRWLSLAWVLQAVQWSFPWLLKGGPSALWSIVVAGEFRSVVAGHVLLALCSAASPVLLWLRREIAAAAVLMGAAVSCLWFLGGLFSPDMLTSSGWLWLIVPRAALSVLTLVVVLLHALGKAFATEELLAHVDDRTGGREAAERAAVDNASAGVELRR